MADNKLELPPEDDAVPQEDDFNFLDDATITEEQISEMKLMGFPKPPNVTWARWVSPKDVRARHDLVIHFAAIGKTNIQIAAETGLTKERVSQLMGAPRIRQLIRERQAEYYGDDAKQKIRSLSHKSFEVFDDVLTNPTHRTSDRVRVAEFITDHAVGKAAQTVEVKGNLLHEIMLKLENKEKEATKLDESGQIVATEIKTVAAPKDAIDNFVDALVLEDATVGKRE